ncbi:MAG: dihydroflavonol-4-reductase, partial [Spirosomataceae bacterium]
MNILITGANGLVGSAVAKRFIAEKHHVKALCRSTADLSLLDEIKDDIELIEGNIMDVLGLQKALRNVDMVIHTAAIVSFNPRERSKMYHVNVQGTANVVDTCLESGVKRLLFVSSIAALGRPANPKKNKELIKINEDQKWEESPLNSHYAKSKYLAECEVWRGQAEGLLVSVLNPSVILGEGDWSRSSTQLFKYVYDENRFYTLGSLNYVDIKDLTEIIYQLTEQRICGERFVVNAGTITYKEFFEKAATAFGKKPPKVLIKPWMTEVLWRIEAIRSRLSGSSPLITKETSKSARTHFHYVNKKIKGKLGISFTP